MNEKSVAPQHKDVTEALRVFQQAAGEKKCRACGCFHNLLSTLEGLSPDDTWTKEFTQAAIAVRPLLLKTQYDCLGCEICYPALIINSLQQIGGETLIDLDICHGPEAKERQGWPPLPGDYAALRYHAPIAVCTLMDDDLAVVMAGAAGPEVALVGSLKTENLGIERLISNVLGNPHLRFVILTGKDSEQAVGHWPGQSLLALADSGIDERGRIIGARGKRPVIRNLPPEAVPHFRYTVEVVDLIGNTDVSSITAVIRQCANRNPGPAAPFTRDNLVKPISGYLPKRAVADPAGYFVIYVDRSRKRLSLEHYAISGVMDIVIEGETAVELYTPVIDRGLVSRLDHAAYLGRELARAEQALRTGEPYIQDAAPEKGAPGLCLPVSDCGCPTSQPEERR